MDVITALAKKKKISEVDEGAVIVRVEGLDAPCMLTKSDGTSTYATRDLAAINFRIKEYKPETILYFVGNEQSLHFKQIFSTAKKLGFKVGLEHLPHGLYLSPEGGRIATRKGTIVLLDAVIDNLITLAKDTIEKKNPDLKNKDEVARIIAVSAMIFNDLVSDRARDVVFNPQKIIDFEGDTGPYLQYTHARAHSILRKAAGEKIVPAVHPDLIKEPAEIKLVKLLSNLPVKIEEAALHRKPHYVAQYLIEVCRSFNEFYHACPVMKAEGHVRDGRLALVQATTWVLCNGLTLLGIRPLEEM
jgi:arginyl-tRNA synthetase